MAKKFRCHRRTEQIPPEELEGMSSEEKDMRLRQNASRDCADCPDKDTCGDLQRREVKESLRLKRKKWRPHGVHICTPRTAEKDPDYRCEKCATEHRKNFVACSHKTINKEQSTLEGYGKKKGEQLKMEEVDG